MPPAETSCPTPVRRALFASVMSAFLVMSCRMESHDERPPVSAEGAAQVSIGEISWYVDYDDALEIAKREDKALWVHFGENPG